MSKKLLLAGVLGGLAAFLWSAIVWMVLNVHGSAMHAFPDAKPVMDAMSTAENPGLYLLPHWAPGDDLSAEEMEQVHEDWMNAAINGPYAVIHVRPDGIGSSPMAAMARGLLIEILAALLIAFVILQIPNSSYWQRVRVATMFGVFTMLVSSLLSWNHMHISWEWTLHEGSDHVLCWFFSGLVIAKFTRPHASTA